MPAALSQTGRPERLLKSQSLHSPNVKSLEKEVGGIVGHDATRAPPVFFFFFVVAGHHRHNPTTSSLIRKGIYYPSTYRHPPPQPIIPPSPIPVWEKTPCHKQLSQSRQRLMELRPCDNAPFVAHRRGSQVLLTLVFLTLFFLMSPPLQSRPFCSSYIAFQHCQSRG